MVNVKSGVVYASTIGSYQLFDSPCRPYGQGVDGYGSKIATCRKLQFAGQSRAYRVYAICYSNSASHYICRQGKRFYI